MSKRNEHTFSFTSFEISQAAVSEADYHAERIGYWERRQQDAKAHVESTIGAKLIEVDVTGGHEYRVVVDHGDPDALEDLNLATQKIRNHRAAAERFRMDATTYSTQPRKTTFELDTEDIRHFRLGGEPRED